MKTKPRSSGRARVVIILIALAAFLPFALAWYYAQHPELIEKTSNYGNLIVPVRQLDREQLLARPLSTAEQMEQLKGRWLLLQVTTGPCNEACGETLHKTHQGWLMLNKEMPRVQRLLLVDPESGIVDAEVVKRDDALTLAGVSPQVLASLKEAIGRSVESGMVILIDPFSNLVLWYERGFDPYQMVKDLKHLLKASQIG